MANPNWKKGVSGNPAGRKKGSLCRKTLLRQEIEKHGAELIAVIKTAALENQDMTAAGMLLARLEAPLRPQARTVEFEFTPDAAPGVNANRVMAAVAAGEIDPDTGHKLLNMLAATVGITDIETFAQELHRMRETKTNHVRGGIKTYDSTRPNPTSDQVQLAGAGTATDT